MSPDARRISNAIKTIESRGGSNCKKGKSGEYGCFQFLTETWKLYSTEVLGYVAPHTKINEEYVVIYMIEKWLRDDLTPEQIALRWNQGNHKRKCSEGINSYGVQYDSCTYVKLVMEYY